ncbi:hypothetical protein F4782DRAFT_535118 [Xylaria castorea]|nr:hypothetical protein F4782DRAFT_535118 [Xylaria castorea]
MPAKEARRALAAAQPEYVRISAVYARLDCCIAGLYINFSKEKEGEPLADSLANAPVDLSSRVAHRSSRCTREQEANMRERETVTMEICDETLVRRAMHYRPCLAPPAHSYFGATLYISKSSLTIATHSPTPTFDITEHKPDVSLFLPLICDGSAHMFEIKILGLVEYRASGAALSTTTNGDTL